MLNVKSFLRSKYSARLTPEDLEDFKVLTRVFPFKVSRYVLDNLIDWKHYTDDPIYRLVFPVREMLSEDHWRLINSANGRMAEDMAIARIRRFLNPHPDGQKKNIPLLNGRPLGGLQHKYRQTVLFFPAAGQTCHSFCTYCFRWAQFVRMDEHMFKTHDVRDLIDYLKVHPEVSDVLITGGDPLYMDNARLSVYIEALLQPELEHIQSIRIGSKAPAYFPQRFLGADGDSLLRLMDKLRKAGKNPTLMAHFSHPRELATTQAEHAARRIIDAGVVIRTQAPLIRPVNADPGLWAEMWQHQVKLGMVPYYMFVERDTGAHHYFSLPLVKALDIYNRAIEQVSGLAKTVRGPSMSTDPGKVLIDGILTVGESRYFVLKFIQARNPADINKVFLAVYDDHATWWDELKPLPVSTFREQKNSKSIFSIPIKDA